ncbi:MAG: hypothetical protein HUU20_21785 [Pirellulales bacterium]|nr:hypothetical protein [Pirellulales bacterium]
MVRLLQRIAVLVFVPVVCGCTSSPWSATKPAITDAAASQPAAPVPADPPAPPANSAAQSPLSAPDPRAMQDVMAQLQQMGNLDPAAREKLMEDLKQTDPRLWQDVLRQFRATLAYRQQSADPQQNARPPASPPQQVANLPIETSHSSPPAAPKQTDAETPAFPSQPRAGPEQPAAGSQVAGPRPVGEPETPNHQHAEKPRVSESQTDRVERASYTAESSESWQDDLERTIRQLERTVASNPRSSGEVAEHARLRMLYLMAGRRDDAFRPIPAASPSVQDFWSKELYGLAAWLDTERIEDPTRRAADAKLHLTEAIARLGETSPLVVRNLAFVTDIQGFGSYKKFSEYQFTPGQEVLLYAEVENFNSESTPKGYKTTLRFGYQIFDSRGQRVAEREFTDEDDCLNMRRDFYIGCRFHIPTRIYDGKHTLQLTVEDLHSQKIGQSSIEFTVAERSR